MSTSPSQPTPMPQAPSSLPPVGRSARRNPPAQAHQCMCMCMCMCVGTDACAGVGVDASVGGSMGASADCAWVWAWVMGHGWYGCGLGERCPRRERRSCGRRDGDAQRRTRDRREDGEPARVSSQSAWPMKASAAAAESAAAARVPALSAPTPRRAPASQPAPKLFGTKSSSAVPKRMRELVHFGDVEKKPRDQLPDVELHQLGSRVVFYPVWGSFLSGRDTCITVYYQCITFKTGTSSVSQYITMYQHVIRVSQCISNVSRPKL